ncbi:MAG: signal peptidase I [Leptospirales bacterium]|nr:signal peptidase I [Leptospirales bacterium]
MSKRGESPVSFTISMMILIFFVFAFKQSILDANNIPSGSMIPTLKIGDYLFVNKMRYSLRVPFAEFFLGKPLELVRIDDPKRGDIITFIPKTDPDKHYVKRVTGLPGDRIRIRNIALCDMYRLYSLPTPDVQRAYSCEQGLRGPREPVVAMVEYRAHDTGPWLNYAPQEISDTASRELLVDADNTVVLPPEANPSNNTYNRLPVVLTEKLDKGTHFIVETSNPPRVEGLCEDIETTGCVLNQDEYLAMGDNRDDSADSRIIGPISRASILGKVAIIYFSINWKDEICESYAGNFMNRPIEPNEGYQIPDFPPEKQRQKCSILDGQAKMESVPGYLKRTILYRLWRLDVRWRRIGNLLR